ncbi:MAG: hypothetical protein R2769_08980 [Saprospiraceae bacterium]
MKKILFLAVSGILLLSACKKETIELSDEDLLTRNGWVVKDFEMTIGSFTFSGTDEMDECELDDIIFFKKEGKSFEKDQGATKCFSVQVQHEKLGTWDYDEITKKVHVKLFDEEDQGIQTMELLEVKENELQLYWEETTVDGEIQNCLITFVSAP